MRLFVSYARVDQRFCTQIIDKLAVHDVWYDQRLYGGQRWWDEIVKHIEWCDGMVFLVSADSLSSEYCRKELNLALTKNKHIFPVIIDSNITLPPSLINGNIVNISRGLSAQVVTDLTNAIHRVANGHQGVPVPALPTSVHADHTSLAGALESLLGISPIGNSQSNGNNDSVIDPETLQADIQHAIETEQYDRVVYLVRNAIAENIEFRFSELPSILKRAEHALAEQAYKRDAAREYEYILTLVRNDKMRSEGCRAFRQFRQVFRDYDPQKICNLCSLSHVPELTWRPIPAGEVTMQYRLGDSGKERKVVYFVPAFEMSKYPITNAQYQLFVDAVDGYKELYWWQFSKEAIAWRRYHPEPMSLSDELGDHPRVRVSWYEAVAFCNWLSYHTALNIQLPSEHQWQRAAQGDDGRQYPWGNRFDKNRCNTRESRIRRTTRVARFMTGASPYGVLDMMGNVWEWCSNVPYEDRDKNQKEPKRVLRGGSYSSLFRKARVIHSESLSPTSQYSTHGFRVVVIPDDPLRAGPATADL